MTPFITSNLNNSWFQFSSIFIFFVGNATCSLPFYVHLTLDQDQQGVAAGLLLVGTWVDQEDLLHRPLSVPLLTCSVGVDVVVVHADASFAMKLVRMSHELDWLSTASLTSEAGSSDW